MLSILSLTENLPYAYKKKSAFIIDLENFTFHRNVQNKSEQIKKPRISIYLSFN